MDSSDAWGEEWFCDVDQPGRVTIRQRHRMQAALALSLEVLRVGSGRDVDGCAEWE